MAADNAERWEVFGDFFRFDMMSASLQKHTEGEGSRILTGVECWHYLKQPGRRDVDLGEGTSCHEWTIRNDPVRGVQGMSAANR